MAKKELTTKQEANRHWLYSKLLYISKPLAAILPTAIMMIVKQEEWFGMDWKVSFGGGVAIFLMFIVSLLINKKTEDKTITNTWIALIIGWYAVSFIFYLIAQISYDIWWIMMVAGIGMLAAAGIDFAEKDQVNKYNEKMTVLAKARENVGTAKAEQELLNPKKKVKVRVRIKEESETRQESEKVSDESTRNI